MSINRPNRKKDQWFAEYENLLVAARPEMAGKVDWYTATYLYNIGKTSADAAAQYLANH